MRAMSFMLTTEQMRNRTKTVTRRLGWNHLKPGDRIIAAVKCQGLGKGGKREDICVIEVVSMRKEPLNRLQKDMKYGFSETTLEGFPEGSPKHWPSEFVSMFCDSMKCDPDAIVNRIEFKYVEPHA